MNNVWPRIVVCFVLAGCRWEAAPSAAMKPASRSPTNVRFVAESGGIAATYRNGAEADQCTILESLGGGVAAFDYDGDGLVDLSLAGGGTIDAQLRTAGLPTTLWRNRGDGRFQSVGAESGLAPAPYYSHGFAVGDYDADGFSDVVLTGYGGLVLWHNEGDGTFRDVTAAAGLNDSAWSSSAAWGDLNGDAILDLYVVHYVDWSAGNHPVCPGPRGAREICPPRSFRPLADTLYFGAGDGTFRDGSAEAGLRQDGKGLGVVLGDVDLDGDLDIYVANDTTENFLYVNDGRGRFAEEGLIRGVAVDDQGVPNGSMGVDLCDYNGDGQPDVWVANYEHESFAVYRNEGRGQFLHVSQATGVTALGGLFVGFGLACADFDGDGDEDVIVANGHVIKYPTSAPRRQLALLLDWSEGRFRRATDAGEYFEQPQEGRGLATADFDGDGDLDVAVAHLNEPAVVLRNESPRTDGWLGVRLIGTRSPRDAEGARLELTTSRGRQLRLVKGGGSYLSHNDRRVNWGLPRDTVVDKLTIHWPSGLVQTIAAPALARLHVIVEPTEGRDLP